MKHIADRNYKDLTLNKHIEKDAVLEEEYEKAGVELTEERKRYLVEERKLYREVEDTSVACDDSLALVHEQERILTTKEEANLKEATPVVEDNNEEEEATPATKETTKKNSNKNETKNPKKNDKK